MLILFIKEQIDVDIQQRKNLALTGSSYRINNYFG